MLGFVYNPPEDESEDGEYELRRNGKPTGISIQDCRSYAGGYSINEYADEGDDFTMTPLGTAKSLKAAKEIALRAASEIQH
jgi:hypothetical protein